METTEYLKEEIDAQRKIIKEQQEEIKTLKLRLLEQDERLQAVLRVPMKGIVE